MTLFAMVPTRRFGVEVEFVGVDPTVAARAITAAGFACEYETYNHDTRNTWKIVRDGSIEYHNGNCGELVSPPLSGEAGIEQVRTVLRALVAAGATVNRSCGLHVHVDANDLGVNQIGSILRRYQAYQNEINRFMPASRRNSRWAKPITAELVRQIESYNNPTTLRRNVGYLDRYYAVNVAAYARHGTVEFRQHSASVNAGKVAHWIAFCLHFVASSIAPATATATATIPATTSNARGRRPNYAARRTLVTMMNGANTITSLSNATGYTRTTIVNLITQLRGMGTVTGHAYLHFHPRNQDALNLWLGNAAAAPAPVASEPVPDNLFRGIPADIASFYNERAMELDPR